MNKVLVLGCLIFLMPGLSAQFEPFLYLDGIHKQVAMTPGLPDKAQIWQEALKVLQSQDMEDGAFKKDLRGFVLRQLTRLVHQDMSLATFDQKQKVMVENLNAIIFQARELGESEIHMNAVASVYELPQTYQWLRGVMGSLSWAQNGWWGRRLLDKLADQVEKDPLRLSEVLLVKAELTASLGEKSSAKNILKDIVFPPPPPEGAKRQIIDLLEKFLMQENAYFIPAQDY